MVGKKGTGLFVAGAAVLLALAVIVVELVTLAWIRRRFFGGAFLSSLVSVTLGGVIITAVSAALAGSRTPAGLYPARRVGGEWLCRICPSGP